MAAAAATNDPYREGLRLSGLGRHMQAIEQFERALVRTPNDARVLFALGNTARALGLAKPAEEFFRRVLALEPERLEAIVNLANLLRANGNPQGAEAILTPALVRAPDSAELLLTLGSAWREMDERGRAETHYRQALALKPDYSAALGNLADLLADRGEIGEALTLYDRALKRDPDNAQARLNRAVLHLLKGNLSDGWRDYTARLKISGKVPEPDHKLPRWAGTALKRTRLLVSAEQGVGDQLMFASLIPELSARARQEGGSVIVECEPRLVALFARSFADVTVKSCELEAKGATVHARYGWLKAAGGANAAIEMGSLPRILRRDIGAFPNPHSYLIPDEAEKSHWRAIFAALGHGPSIGICWRSGKTGGGRSLQYAPMGAWAQFLRELPGQLVCAQYDATADEIAALEEMSGRGIFTPPGIDQKQELDHACAMLSSLDAVVSAPTAVSWLSAGAGVPTCKILYDTSWTSFGQVHEPFAPACLCAMPDRPGNWDDAFGKVASAIRALPA
jgi:tetratricopeptide (TPR) repeat protein